MTNISEDSKFLLSEGRMKVEREMDMSEAGKIAALNSRDANHGRAA